MTTRTTRPWLPFAAAVILLLAGFALGNWWGGGGEGADPVATSSPSGSGERRVLYWYDPMVPDQHFDQPGKSPFMDMMLVPKYADEATEGGVAIAPEVRQNLGIRTAAVARGRLDRAFTVPGTIGWDVRREYVVSVPVDAVVGQLHVKAPFETVTAGQPLVSVFAPTWSTALADVHALERADSDSARALRAAARQRLRALGLPPGARSADDGGIVLTAPVRGTVSEIAVREGEAVSAGALLMRVNGLDTVWLEASVPQADVVGLRAGAPVEATVSALPGRRFEGRIEALLPSVEASSRTQPVRIELDNPDALLAPGMYAQVRLHPEEGDEVSLVPVDAVIGFGEAARVIVQDEERRFTPVAVRTGRSRGGFTEILDGLEGGERVVVSGQFLIDSEASLSGALGRLDAAAAGDGATEEAAMPDEATSRPAGADAGTHGSHSSAGQGADALTRPRRRCPVRYWYDPMVPDQHFDEPGQSPFMEMRLVPKFGPEADPDCTIRDVEAVP